MDFLRQSTRCVGAAPVTLVSSVPVLECGCKNCVISNETLVQSNLTEALRVESLSCSDFTSGFDQHACVFSLVLRFFIPVSFPSVHDEQLTCHVNAAEEKT